MISISESPFATEELFLEDADERAWVPRTGSEAYVQSLIR